MKKIAYVGIDYHLNSLSIAVMLDGEKDFHQSVRLANNDKLVFKYMKKLSRDFEIKACYEASGSGFAFQRKMAGWGYQCDVIAPSLIPKKRGDRRKNDFRDARDLAQNYAHDMLTIVCPPTEYEESVRALIRCRLAIKEAEKTAKLQINSFLLSQGLHREGNKWTHPHRNWLRTLKLGNHHLQQVLEEYLALLGYLEIRIRNLDERIEEIAQSDIYAPSVKKLRAFKGIGTLAAMLLIAEITDFRRFGSPRALMAFLGLIPSENSSGDKQQGGSITKAGNRRCRTQLIESVQHYVRKPCIGPQMKHDLSQVDAKTAQLSMKCMERLHRRYWALALKGKIRQVAITAIAREFAGFIWAMMQPEPVAN
jgi:transposase